MIRVAIVDDHPVARRGLGSVVASAPGFAVVLLTDSAAAVDPAAVDVVLHDLYLGRGGPALASISELSAWTNVATTAAVSRPGDVLAAVRAGARAHLTRDTPDEVVAATVAGVAAGRFVASPELAGILRGALPLAAGEAHMLDLIAEGLTGARLEDELDVPPGTVEVYLERIRRSLQNAMRPHGDSGADRGGPGHGEAERAEVDRGAVDLAGRGPAERGIERTERIWRPPWRQ